jgi:enediyne biosynthesis protein E4
MTVHFRSVFSIAFLGWVCCAVSPGCGQPATTPTSNSVPPPGDPWFADVTTELGLDFTHDPGPVDGKYFMPQINGSGAALFDCDNDGRLDIYLLQCGGPDSKSANALFRQTSGGKFQDISKTSGLDINGYNFGVAVGDVNNDGWSDVLVTQYMGVKMFLNQGKGVFGEATAQAGLQNPYWGASASFVDFDQDGWLDLVVVNYLDFDEARQCTGRGGKRDYCLPNIFPGTPARLWRNLGGDAAGKWLGYEDRTAAAGLEEKPGPGMGVLCADFSGDGWPDIFVTNDLAANHLWINQRNGTFTEEGVPRGVAFDARGAALSNMGVAYGDVDGNGLSDLFVTHFTNEHHGLWMQQPRGSFEELTIQAGLSQSHWHGTAWGTALADFNQDGALDLALMNGYVQRRDAPSSSYWDDYEDRNQVFANDGRGHFRDISSDNPALCGEPNVGRGLCLGDIDNDGALDLLVTQIGGPARILRNKAPARGHWLIVRAFDPVLRRDALGAEVRVVAGKRRWQSIIQPGQSYQCANDPRAHFGLGAVDRIESIEVLWPDGTLESFPCPRVDRLMEVQHGKGKAVLAKGAEGP